MSYLQFCTGDISPRSFAFGWAFHRPPKLLFSWFARVIARAQAIARASCQGLSSATLGFSYSSLAQEDWGFLELPDDLLRLNSMLLGNPFDDFLSISALLNQLRVFLLKVQIVLSKSSDQSSSSALLLSSSTWLYNYSKNWQKSMGIYSLFCFLNLHGSSHLDLIIVKCLPNIWKIPLKPN